MMRKNDAGAGQGVSVIALGARVVGNVHTTGVAPEQEPTTPYLSLFPVVPEG